MQKNAPIPLWRGLFWTIVIFGSVAAGIAFKIGPLVAQSFALKPMC